MKNIEKYENEISKLINRDYKLSCAIATVSGIKHSHKCNIRCIDCQKECFEWLNQEYKEPILDDVEREYLSAVIKPFRNKVKNIVKISEIGKSKEQYIRIVLGELDFMNFPNFNKNTGMYKGMEADKLYSLEELGL